MSASSRGPVVFFDGVCNLCNGFIQFLVRHDRQRNFRYSPLQSTAGARLLQGYPVDTERLDSIVLLHNGNIYERSEAFLRICKELGGRYRLLWVFRVLPLSLRDALYNLIARYRYRIWGEKDHCMIPTPELMDRFLMD